jgi:hypothetical protein
MGLTMSQCMAVTKATATRYRSASVSKGAEVRDATPAVAWHSVVAPPRAHTASTLLLV